MTTSRWRGPVLCAHRASCPTSCYQCLLERSERASRDTVPRVPHRYTGGVPAVYFHPGCPLRLSYALGAVLNCHVCERYIGTVYVNEKAPSQSRNSTPFDRHHNRCIHGETRGVGGAYLVGARGPCTPWRRREWAVSWIVPPVYRTVPPNVTAATNSSGVKGSAVAECTRRRKRRKRVIKEYFLKGICFYKHVLLEMTYLKCTFTERRPCRKSAMHPIQNLSGSVFESL